MKFLVFNLVVIAALVYLFNDQDVGLDSLRAKAVSAVETVKAKSEKTTLAKEIPVEENPGVNSEPMPAAYAQLKLESQATPPLPEPIEPPLFRIPEVEPLTLEPEMIPQSQPAQEPTDLSFSLEPDSELMTGKDRRKALMQLAEEMEYFSAEAISQ